MARVTIEDCLDHIPNRFELVMIAVERARKLEMGGTDPLVEWEKDKPSVVALREIAAGKIGPGLLMHHLPAQTDINMQHDAGDAGEGSGEVS